MGTAMQGDLRVLCYQHHQEMLPRLRSESTEPLVYVCREPGCLIRYDSSKGYFSDIDVLDKDTLEREIQPRVRCASDERPMYLAQTLSEIKNFRLWKCPECGSCRTNENSSTWLQKEMGA